MMKSLWEKKLRMVWRIEQGRSKSFLVGTAHFFPYSFRKSLICLIEKTDSTLFEGPLDEGNMEAVRAYGLKGWSGPSLYEALHPRVIRMIDGEVRNRAHGAEGLLGPYTELFQPKDQELLTSEIDGLRPWMAFFKLWSQFLIHRGWKYSVDLEALAVARELGKKVVFLETIEEQLAALDGIPFDRIVNYVNDFGIWGKYSRRHRRQYLKGSLDGLLNTTSKFPSRCASIVDQRDPVLYRRMKPYLDEGNAGIFLGTTHIPGVTRLLEDNGFTVSQYTP